jgi:Holliday junction DNA helicase RuvA
VRAQQLRAGNLHYSEALKPPSEIDPAVVLLDKSVPQRMRDAVAALVNLGYAQPQAAAAIAAAARNTGAGADAAKLIRRGVRQAKLAE